MPRRYGIAYTVRSYLHSYAFFHYLFVFLKFFRLMVKSNEFFSLFVFLTWMLRIILVTVDMEVIIMKGYFKVPRSLVLVSNHQMQLSGTPCTRPFWRWGWRNTSLQWIHSAYFEPSDAKFLIKYNWNILIQQKKNQLNFNSIFWRNI